MSMNAVSLFSGAGGSSLGYKRAGFEMIGAVDCAPEGYTDSLLKTYRENHDTPLFEYNVRELDGQDLLDQLGLERGDLDLLDGSPPCSPFSNATSHGEKGLAHKGGTLFDEYTRLIDETEPRYFAAENVPGLATGQTRGYFKRLCSRLQDAGPGYTLDVSKIEAHKLGSPHRRTRLIFRGSRSDCPDPAPISYTGTTTLRNALRGVSNNSWELEEARDKVLSSKNSSAYRALSPGQSLDEVLGEGYGYTHQRLRWDYPSPNPVGQPEFVHPSQNRFITISELKRIIGLPDDYELAGDSFNQKWECAIRCLPPVLMQTVGESIQEVQ